jgi:hypothetical protein
VSGLVRTCVQYFVAFELTTRDWGKMRLFPDPAYSGPRTCRSFDFSPFDAQTWLEERVADPGFEQRHRNQLQQETTMRQYSRLAAHTEFGEMVALLRRYISMVILEPQRTERDWWVVTSVPATGKRKGYRRLACISIQWIEMMLISEQEIDGIWTVGGFINVPIDVGEAWLQRASQDLLDRTWARDSWYKNSGMLARIEFDSLATFAELIEDPELIDGSEALAFRMMQRGTTPYARFHDFNLADDIFGRNRGSNLEK